MDWVFTRLRLNLVLKTLIFSFYNCKLRVDKNFINLCTNYYLISIRYPVFLFFQKLYKKFKRFSIWSIQINSLNIENEKL